MNSENPRTAYKQLLIELRKLKRVHGATILSYERTIEHLQNQLRIQEINGKTKISVSIAGEEYVIESSPFAMIKRLSETYPSILRESLFVRAISQFETFLVDTVREISERTKEPFKKQEKLSYPQAQLLSFKSIHELHEDIIQNECRQLTSRGFDYITRYYESQFGIRFSDSTVDISRIREMHERRHLFVHRMGVVDEQYQQLFAPELKVGDQLKVAEKYFQEAINTLIDLAEFITTSVKVKWLQTEKIQVISEDLIEAWTNSDVYQRVVQESKNETYLAYWIKAEFESEGELEAHLNPNFAFKAEDNWHSLSDVLIACKKISELEAEWIVGGLKKIVGPYIGYQIMLSRRDRFVEFQLQKLKE